MSATLHRPVRIGAVSYLNSKPLIAGLSASVPDDEVTLDYPSRLADDLKAGLLDVALIPSVEFFSAPSFEIVSDACVAARGAVFSVKVYFRCPPGAVRTLAADEGSRTSLCLARVMLSARYGVSPVLQPFPLRHSVSDTSADAVLLIGDRAMRPPAEQFCAVWDLGEEWNRWTGLPFVFAMWVARSESQLEAVDLDAARRVSTRLEAGRLDELADVLGAARDRGVNSLREIAAIEGPKLGIEPEFAYRYFTENLHFRFSSRERSGLKLFAELAGAQGLIPHDRRLRFHDSKSA